MDHLLAFFVWLVSFVWLVVVFYKAHFCIAYFRIGRGLWLTLVNTELHSAVKNIERGHSIHSMLSALARHLLFS